MMCALFVVLSSMLTLNIFYYLKINKFIIQLKLSSYVFF